MRVYKDDEMIAEITGAEVGESSSFEEPILLLICTEFAFQAFRSEIEDTFEALHSGSQFNCTVPVHVASCCSEVMLRGHGLRPWSKAWSTVMFQGHVRQSRSEVMLWGDIWRPCFEEYEGNDKFWGVSIVNCKLNPTGCWSPYTARPVGGGRGVMGKMDLWHLLWRCPQTTEKWALNYDSESRHLINDISLFINGNKYQSQKVQCVILCNLHVID